MQDSQNWLIDRNNLILKFWFYKLPKYLLASYGIIAILFLAKLSFYKQNIELQKKLLLLILALIFTPLVVSIFKHYSPIYCPNFITEFGGEKPHISVLDIFDGEIFLQNSGKCFPAGHASGGFALISLYFVMPDHWKRYSLFFALLLGSIMGLYQIAKGAHYLSDTIVTLTIAYLVSLTLERVILSR